MWDSNSQQAGCRIDVSSSFERWSVVAEGKGPPASQPAWARIDLKTDSGLQSGRGPTTSYWGVGPQPRRRPSSVSPDAINQDMLTVAAVYLAARRVTFSSSSPVPFAGQARWLRSNLATRPNHCVQLSSGACVTTSSVLFRGPTIAIIIRGSSL